MVLVGGVDGYYGTGEVYISVVCPHPGSLSFCSFFLHSRLTTYLRALLTTAL